MRSRLLIASLAFLAVAAACSSSEDSTTASSTPTAPTVEATPQPTSDPTVGATTVPATDSSEPPGDTAPIDTDLHLGGPVPPGAPDVVVERVPLPYCGAVLVLPSSANPFKGIEVIDDAGDCYRRRAEAGLPVEMIEIRSTIEGDPILVIRRLLPDGREEAFSDLTRDAFGTQAWFRLVCAGHQPRGS